MFIRGEKMNLKIKHKEELLLVYLGKFSLVWMAVTSLVCVGYYQLAPPTFLTFLMFCVGLLFFFLVIIPQSPVSHHNLICIPEENLRKAKQE